MKELVGYIFRRQWRALFLLPTKNSWIQLFRYGFVGGASFCIDFAVYCFLGWCGILYLAAGVIAFVISFLFNFTVSRWLIFSAETQKNGFQKEFICVLLISAAGLALTELLLFLCTGWGGLDYRISKIIASGLVLLWNYFARKYFAYAS